MEPPWLSAVAAAVTLRGPSLCWFDEVVAPEMLRYTDDGSILNQSELVDTVTGLLYKLFYCAGAPVLWGSYNSRLSAMPAASIADLLHAANAGRGRREADWRYVGPATSPDGGTVVEKDGLRVTVPEAPPTRPVVVTLPHGSFGRSQGFYVAHSDVPFPMDAPLSRLYLNVSYPGAGPMMQLVTTLLNERRLPFDFKVANAGTGFNRCDSAVLYFPRRNLPTLLELLLPRLLEAGRRGYLRDVTPALTCRLTSGVAAADDPENGDSFGHHRCQVIAHGIVAALTSDNPALKVRAIQAAFTRAALDLHRPYLNASTTDPYAHHCQQSVTHPA
ncbi:hypothetical protein GGR26_003153 [Lewinella marina]|uniref:Uncharacterized protein n=1 Tax=Neolewinella marina TaxID=438751 RepID=A0A2G0CEB1_9BACT|nr:T3SS effector HopA1 family protein [Neolewinella marina]NJB87373.1 hypothetical protein [Neolewinella marina]PHK98313.1 hypothetical protein CGL56_11465 [Neolewinella marina]